MLCINRYDYENKIIHMRFYSSWGKNVEHIQTDCVVVAFQAPQPRFVIFPDRPSWGGLYDVRSYFGIYSFIERG
jgi:hypothetical protein